MSKTELQDTFLLDDVRRTSDGYVTAFAKVARTGIQVYRGAELGRPDLAQVRLYRPPEEVFSKDAMSSMAHRPVTLRHPPKPVTAKNWKQYAGGQTGGDVVRDGDFVRVPLVMMDQGLIDAYEKHGVKELSMGYSTDIKWTTGVTDSGEPYDAVQTAIRGNHLAVVPVARGGDQLRIGDAMVTCPECGAKVDDSEEECPECGYDFDDNLKDHKGELQMKTLLIDGVNCTVGDDQSGQIIERHIASLKSAIAAKDADIENFKKKKKDDEDAVTDAKTKLEAKDGEIAVLKKQVADAAVTPIKLDALVKGRLAVIDGASKVLPKDFTFDGKTEAEIRRAVVAAHMGDSIAKDMTDAGVEGAFLAIVAKGIEDGGTRPIRDAIVGRRPGNGNLVDAAATAYNESTKALSDAWRNPNGVAK